MKFHLWFTFAVLFRFLHLLSSRFIQLSVYVLLGLAAIQFIPGYFTNKLQCRIDNSCTLRKPLLFRSLNSRYCCCSCLTTVCRLWKIDWWFIQAYSMSGERCWKNAAGRRARLSRNTLDDDNDDRLTWCACARDSGRKTRKLFFSSVRNVVVSSRKEGVRR